MSALMIRCISIHSECRIWIERKGRSEKAPALVHERRLKNIKKDVDKRNQKSYNIDSSKESKNRRTQNVQMGSGTGKNRTL